MLFYKIEMTFENEIGISKRENREEYDMFISELKEQSKGFFERSDKTCFFFASKIFKKRITIGGILKNADKIEGRLESYLEKTPLTPNEIYCEETTLQTISSMLSDADRYDFIEDDSEILDLFKLGNIAKYRRGFHYDESIAEIRSLDELLYSDSMILKSVLADEIKRVYEIPAKKNMKGHPVHYLIRSNEEEQKNIYTALLSALYTNNRILSKRYCSVECTENNHITNGYMELLYESCECGTVILKFNSADFEDSQYLKSEEGLLSDVCKIASKYRNKVLTIFCFPPNSNKFKNKLHIHMGTTTFIELYEDVVWAEIANTYLSKLAKEHGVDTDNKLLISHEEKQLFTSDELKEKFNVWYDSKLRSDLFPQYKVFQNGNQGILACKPDGSAYQELQNMVGLTEIKKEIDKIINYFKSQKLFGERNIKLDQPAMHMVFTGNPGTAKTTVARLFAQILKENEILSEGKLYEVGRADLVGKYVGQTAPLVKEAFKRAKGSVLFIDEAYSLVEKEGLYGDEAINTIVQEMENNRQDTVVIFAGYPDEMEKFLRKNPGLRSRISHNIHFEDYSSDELCQISKQIAEQKGIFFTDDATDKLRHIFELARQNMDFGNGRFARNIVEAAQMTQIDRILCSGVASIENCDISKLRKPLPKRFKSLTLRLRDSMGSLESQLSYIFL